MGGAETGVGGERRRPRSFLPFALPSRRNAHSLLQSWRSMLVEETKKTKTSSKARSRAGKNEYIFRAGNFVLLPYSPTRLWRLTSLGHHFDFELYKRLAQTKLVSWWRREQTKRSKWTWRGACQSPIQLALFANFFTEKTDSEFTRI